MEHVEQLGEVEDAGPDAILAVSGREPRVVGCRVGDYRGRRLVDQCPGHDGRCDHQDEDQSEADRREEAPDPAKDLPFPQPSGCPEPGGERRGEPFLRFCCTHNAASMLSYTRLQSKNWLSRMRLLVNMRTPMPTTSPPLTMGTTVRTGRIRFSPREIGSTARAMIRKGRPRPAE